MQHKPFQSNILCFLITLSNDTVMQRSQNNSSPCGGSLAASKDSTSTSISCWFGYVLAWGYFRAALKWAAGLPEAHGDRWIYLARVNEIHCPFLSFSVRQHRKKQSFVLQKLDGCQFATLNITYVCIFRTDFNCLFCMCFVRLFLLCSHISRNKKSIAPLFCPKKDLFELKLRFYTSWYKATRS